MGKSDKTKDTGIIGARKDNESIHAEKDCCADGTCGWKEPTDTRSVGDKGGA